MKGILFYRLREIITGFVTQTDPLLREQVLKRLDTLIYLQGELNMLLTLCDVKYQPPPCYFHYFPLPQFIKIERKTSKKGKKPMKGNKLNISVNVEDESREISSILCSKNPAYFRKFDAKVLIMTFSIAIYGIYVSTNGVILKTSN